jgi:hypothetical protein
VRRRLGALVLAAAAACACHGPEGKGGGSTAGGDSSRAPARDAPPGKLLGDWMRTDQKYLIQVEDVNKDGTLRARYLNPAPINVSRAEWQLKDGRLRMTVELRDELYPGSNYELTYDPGSDALYGVYHHLGVKQDFEVSFYRQGAPAPAK